MRRPVSQGPSDCLKPGGLVTVFAGSKQCPLQFLHPCLQCVIFFYNLYFCRYYEEKPQEEFQEEPKKVQEESQSGSRGAKASSRVFEILVHLIPFFLFFVCGLIQVYSTLSWFGSRWWGWRGPMEPPALSNVLISQ